MALKELNEFLKYSAKLSEANANVEFIKQCMEINRYPKHYWKSLRRSNIRPNAITLKRHALNSIDSLNSGITVLQQNAYQRQWAVDDLTKNLKSQFLEYVCEVQTARANKQRIRLLETLDDQSPQSLFPPDPSRYVHNFSSLVLDVPQLQVLSLGLKFCDVKSSVNNFNAEVAFENLMSQTTDLKHTSDKELEYFKSCLVHGCLQYVNSRCNSGPLLTKIHRDALKELYSNKDLLISRQDKGAGVVLLDRSDYLHKMNTILSDVSKFQKLPQDKDSTEKKEHEIAKLLEILKKDNMITPDVYSQLRPSGLNIPRLYGLPKVHKPRVPMRPMLDMSNSPYHQLAKWLAKIIEPVRRKVATHSLKDVFEFIDKVKDIEVSNKTMMSLDVTSLFTNVPLMETIDYILESITSHNMEIGLPPNKLKELILKCTMNVQFTFNGQLYRQIDGVAMGSPLGPILADIFMAQLENGPLTSMMDQIHFYCRYVDDTFVVCKNTVDIPYLVSVANNAHRAIQLTYEKENANHIPFLDVSLRRQNDGKLSRSMYRKASWTGQ